MKAIETLYNGYKFRSRLEARWAVFFDTLGVKWEYEKEGYQLPGGVWYLPDFWLPELDCWVEIKGDINGKGGPPDREAQDKVSLITLSDNHWQGIIRVGPPDSVRNEGYVWWAGKCFGTQVFIECLECGRIGYMAVHDTQCILSWRLRCDCRLKKHGKTDLADITTDSPRLIAAYTAARQARFEHGENGGKHEH